MFKKGYIKFCRSDCTIFSNIGTIGTTCQTRFQVKSRKECSRTNSINYISRIANRFAINETSSGTNNSFDPNVFNQLQTSTQSVSDINMPIIVNLNHDYSQMSDTDYPNLFQDYNNPISKRPRLSDSYV
ncbi:hypothetical protein ACTFIZ_007627 [Dictyostelium cf. discoideum]